LWRSKEGRDPGAPRRGIGVREDEVGGDWSGRREGEISELLWYGT
jgi:hypothetical protein